MSVARWKAFRKGRSPCPYDIMGTDQYVLTGDQVDSLTGGGAVLTALRELVEYWDKIERFLPTTFRQNNAINFARLVIQRVDTK